MPNRLIDETSPYLLQHAHNPVEWYPWGEEALARSREENKPILLSIGYSACHWCHVMERESFEDEGIASLMNANFVNVKVDREERPDLDAVYMAAVQMLTGSGGWPMTVFLTPDGKPFYGGTYFPPADRMNMPGFPRVLLAVTEAYRNNKGEIDRVTQQLTQQMRRTSQLPAGSAPLTVEIMHQAYTLLAADFDYQNGGFGAAPKFPQPMTPEFLLRCQRREYGSRALEMVEHTLEKMACGGIYDQLGGGFHRYSTDAFWLVPHFEKMLYDNALLSRLYLHAYQVTGRNLYRRITEETLDYVLREMTDRQGGFYSAQDADSEGVEGRFFVWTPAQLRDALGTEEGDLLGGYFGVTDAGNFEGANILHVPQNPETFALDHGISEERLASVIARGRARLLAERERRPHPFRDDKVLAAWNGLMLQSFSEAAAALGRQDYRQAAIANASFLTESMLRDGRLLRSSRAGQARLPGFLEDYASVIAGLLALYEATFDQKWLARAVALADTMIELFWDEGVGGFYDTSVEHEALVTRPRDVFDNAQPCGGSVAAEALLRLAVFTGNNEYHLKGARPLRSLERLMRQAPSGVAHWLGALDFYLSPPREVAIIGPRQDPDTRRLQDEVFGRYLPNKVVVGLDPAAATEAVDNGAALSIPLLAQRDMVNGLPTAYVCQHYVCQLPVTDADALARQLAD